MNWISFLVDALSLVGIVFLTWDKVRGGLLRARFNGKSFPVPRDEVRESFRRAALGKASALFGGRRLQLEVKWDGNVLLIEGEEPEENAELATR